MRTFTRYLIFLTSIALFAGCTNSNPAIEILQKSVSASELSITLRNLASPAQVSGECDKRSMGLDVSYDDGATWTNMNTISGADVDCSDGAFSFTVPQSSLGFEEKTSGVRRLQVRQHLGGLAQTAAFVTIKYVSPLGPRQDKLRLVIGKLKPANGLPFDMKIRAYARGAAR